MHSRAPGGIQGLVGGEMHILIQEQHLREVPQSRQSQVCGVPIKLQAQLEDSPQEDGGVTESVYVMWG